MAEQMVADALEHTAAAPTAPTPMASIGAAVAVPVYEPSRLDEIAESGPLDKVRVCACICAGTFLQYHLCHPLPPPCRRLIDASGCSGRHSGEECLDRVVWRAPCTHRIALHVIADYCRHLESVSRRQERGQFA